MAGKHYRWQLNWTVDTAESTATHNSGLIVLFTPLSQSVPPSPPPTIGTQCWAPDGRRWVGALQGGDDALHRWLVTQATHGLRDQRSIEHRLARLMREAGEIYSTAQQESRHVPHA